MNDPIMQTRGNQPKLSGIEDSKYRYMAREPIEIVITSPDIIRRGLLPALSTRIRDTRDCKNRWKHIRSKISKFYLQWRVVGLLLR